MKYLILYLVVINLIALIVTVADKNAAVHHRWRVSEKALMLIAAFGGSVVMLVTMLVINHKTNKPLFMIGIPLMIVLELAAAVIGGHYVCHLF